MTNNLKELNLEQMLEISGGGKKSYCGGSGSNSKSKSKRKSKSKSKSKSRSGSKYC